MQQGFSIFRAILAVCDGHVFGMNETKCLCYMREIKKAFVGPACDIQPSVFFFFNTLCGSCHLNFY